MSRRILLRGNVAILYVEQQGARCTIVRAHERVGDCRAVHVTDLDRATKLSFNWSIVVPPRSSFQGRSSRTDCSVAGTRSLCLQSATKCCSATRCRFQGSVCELHNVKRRDPELDLLASAAIILYGLFNGSRPRICFRDQHQVIRRYAVERLSSFVGVTV